MSERLAAGSDLLPVRRLIRKTRWLLRSSWGLTGLGLTAGLFLGILTLVVAIDLIAPLGVPLRVAALLLTAAPAATAFVVGVVRPALRRLRSVEVARRIRAPIPRMPNPLVAV